MIEKMKNFIKKVTGFLKNLFTDLFEELKKNSFLAVKITDKLKEMVESPVLDFVVDNLIKGEVDNFILEKLRVILPEVAFKIAVVHGIMQESDSSSESIAKLVEYLKGLNPNARVAFWVLFSGELNLSLADGKINLAEAFALAQLAYNELKGRKV